MPNKILVAISGASGAIYARLLIEKLLTLKTQWEELSVVMSSNAKDIWTTEMPDESFQNYKGVSFYDKNDFNAPFASGSGKYNIMFVAPCSMGTLSRISNGISDDLITRAADVILKERRKLLLLLREAPYSLVHIKNMEAATLAGAIICPATPSFYSKPKTIEELSMTVVDRLIDLAGLDITTFRWGQDN